MSFGQLQRVAAVTSLDILPDASTTESFGQRRLLAVEKLKAAVLGTAGGARGGGAGGGEMRRFADGSDESIAMAQEMSLVSD